MLSSYVVLDCDFGWVVLRILKLRMCPFNGCSLIQLKKSIGSEKKINRLLRNVFNSITEINRLKKEVSTLLSKRMSSIFLKVTI